MAAPAPWVVIESGCNAVHALMYEIDRLRSVMPALAEWREAVRRRPVRIRLGAPTTNPANHTDEETP